MKDRGAAPVGDEGELLVVDGAPDFGLVALGRDLQQLR